VSIVSGRLVVGANALDAMLAAFPGGSITGAPKYRACEIICHVEANGRGPYCGTLGYVGFDGNADWNILIRTFVVREDSITFSAGGGVTVGSDPAMEYAESLHKAEGMLSVFESTVAGGST
jgi:para-aminobenzoate synthetase component 1